MVVLIKEKGPFVKSTAISLGKNTKGIRYPICLRKQGHDPTLCYGSTRFFRYFSIIDAKKQKQI